MKHGNWTRAVLVLAVAAGMGACEYPTRPTHHSPVISSMVAFPQVLGPGESTLVTVNAFSPDGDSLDYFWYAAPYVGPKGQTPWDQFVVTRSSSLVYYRSADSVPEDTNWVRCEVYDSRGGSGFGQAPILLRN